MTKDKAALAGMRDAQIAAADRPQRTARWKAIVIPLQNTTQQPGLASFSNRAHARGDVRESWTAPNTATPTIRARHRPDRATARAEGESCWAIPTLPRGNWKTRWPRPGSGAEVHGRARAPATARRHEAQDIRT